MGKVLERCIVKYLKYLGLIVLFIVLSCDTNFYYELSDKETTDAKIGTARVKLDKRDYSGAVDILEPIMDGPDDSNEVRLLYAAAKLGVAGLDVWGVIETLLDSSTEKKSNSGIDNILDSFTDSLLGAGEERERKVSALSAAVTCLKNAPDPGASRVVNTSCFLAGIMAVPSIMDAQAYLNAINDALNSLSENVNQGEECTNIDNLTSSLDKMKVISDNLTMIMGISDTCPFLNVNQAQDMLNTVEKKLKKLMTAADKGCKTIPSAISHADQLFPECVKTAMGIGSNSTAAANDGNIVPCEFVLYCRNPGDCFE